MIAMLAWLDERNHEGRQPDRHRRGGHRLTTGATVATMTMVAVEGSASPFGAMIAISVLLGGAGARWITFELARAAPAHAPDAVVAGAFPASDPEMWGRW